MFRGSKCYWGPELSTTGLESGLLRPQYFTDVIIAVIISTLVTPPLLKSVFQEEAVRKSP